MATKNITYKVPENNKEVFVEPAIDRISDMVLANRQKISDYKFEINGIPFQALRNKLREELLHKAAQYTNGIKSLLREQSKHGQTSLSMPPSNKQLSIEIPPHQDELHVKGQSLNYESIKNIPIIQTGHEPILCHPGVWIKNHLIQYLAKKLDGIGVNMIVDNDACNMGFMYVPILYEKPSYVQKVMLVNNMDNMAYEEIVFDNIEMILRFKEDVLNIFGKNTFDENAIPTFECMQTAFNEFINHVVEYYQQGCADMVGLLTSARSSLERGFGIENLEIPVSWMCDTDEFYRFFLHILNRANQFAITYNKKLAEYRIIHKIRSKANPLPDLKIAGNLVELPFWIWKVGGQRDRCYILNDGEFIKITNNKDILVTIKKNEEFEKNMPKLRASVGTSIKIRPRAITTTMFSRLFFSDVFIHGIGGAKYDIITDEIIREFFGVEPPAFATISSTLFLPFNTFDASIKELQWLAQVVNDMRYNPERYASKEARKDADFINRVEEKQRLLKMINVCNKNEKRQYFNQIKELNRLLLTQINTEFQNKQREINKIRNDLVYNEVVRFREYPVFIYPMKVLREYFLSVFSSA